jgi:cob(I)alamin adenosyltransferase
MSRCSTGKVQVYTGEGKGKTTAALGLALRAAGAGLRVFIAQFLKCGRSSELKVLRKLNKHIVAEQYGRTRRPCGAMGLRDRKYATAGLTHVRKVVMSGDFDVVILDEANVAVHENLFSVDDLMALIKDRPPGVELVFTGRYAHPRLVRAADLVTEMHNVKHYYSKGVRARKGIEL